MRIQDAQTGVEERKTFNKLRQGLLLLPDVNRLRPLEYRREVVDKLARHLVDAVSFARLGTPPMKRKPLAPVSPPVPCRIRAPGGGRKPDVTREILASDVARVLQNQRIRIGRWHGGSSGLRESGAVVAITALCWQLAKGHTVPIRDQRRVCAKAREWVLPKGRAPGPAFFGD